MGVRSYFFPVYAAERLCSDPNMVTECVFPPSSFIVPTLMALGFLRFLWDRLSDALLPSSVLGKALWNL